MDYADVWFNANHTGMEFLNSKMAAPGASRSMASMTKIETDTGTDSLTSEIIQFSVRVNFEDDLRPFRNLRTRAITICFCVTMTQTGQWKHNSQTVTLDLQKQQHGLTHNWCQRRLKFEVS